MLRPGDDATCSTKARDVSDRSASTTTTPSPRITGLLNTAVSTTKAKSGRIIRLIACTSIGLLVFSAIAIEVLLFGLVRDHAALAQFVDAPTGPVMVVKDAEGREHWVLATPEYLRKVEMDAGLILVDWPLDPETGARS